MAEFSKIREHMVENQIEPGGVDDAALLEAFKAVPREEFLPDKYKDIACVDEDIKLPNGEFLIEPLVLARLLHVAKPRDEDIVLNLGDYTGYSSAVLSELVTTIVAMETREEMLGQARNIWADMNYCNIAIINDCADQGCPEHAPYSLIVLNGAVTEVPQKIKEQLTIGGRLVCVLRPDYRSPGAITLIEREGENAYSQRALYNAKTPFLKGFEPVETFSMKAFA